MSTELASGLAAVVGAREITDLTRLSGGASRETWRFVADGRPLILQRQRSGDGRDMGIEAGVLRAAGDGELSVRLLDRASSSRNRAASCSLSSSASTSPVVTTAPTS